MKDFLRKTTAVLTRIASAATAAAMCACQSGVEMPTAKNVDLEKYMGEWIEVARIENPFQAGMTSCRATYELKENGKVRVVNSGIKPDGKFSSAEGVAYAPDPKKPSRLRVSFFWPFYSDYIIMDIAPDYSWAIVGGGNGKYLWVLARKYPDKSERNALFSRVQTFGYDISKFVFDE